MHYSSTHAMEEDPFWVVGPTVRVPRHHIGVTNQITVPKKVMKNMTKIMFLSCSRIIFAFGTCFGFGRNVQTLKNTLF